MVLSITAPDQAVPTTTASSRCPSRFRRLGPGCYLLHATRALPWAEAERYCQGLDPGAHLASVTGQREQDLLYLVASSSASVANTSTSPSPSLPSVPGIWLGLSRGVGTQVRVCVCGWGGGGW